MAAQNQQALDTERKKVILIVLDGLAYQTAADCMGYMQSLVLAGQATFYKQRCELPSLSRPLYETILTGTTPLQHGVLHNHVTRLSSQESIFSLASQAGLTTAAAAYNWVSELYNRSPWCAARDRHTHNSTLPIQHGVFYSQDHYPDCHLFADAEYLRSAFNPDFLLIHPMNIDDAGHKAGLDSALYRNSARHADSILSDFLPQWIEQGYQILVTADHGMNEDYSHGGSLDCEQEVPLFVIGNGFSHDGDCTPKQTEICGAVCSLLGVDHQKTMAEGLLIKAQF